MSLSYQHILVAIDESPISYAAVEHACILAKDLDAKITLMSVVAVDPFKGIDFYKVAPAITDYFLHAEQNAQNRLTELHAKCVCENIQVQTKVIHDVTPSEGILQVADDVSADLIIMGSHGHHGVKKMILGSVAQNVLNQSRHPVLIIKR